MPALHALHPHLQAILERCPAYYHAVADDYVARINAGETVQQALRECFYGIQGDEASAYVATLTDDEPTRGERMLVRKLAKIPSV